MVSHANVPESGVVLSAHSVAANGSGGGRRRDWDRRWRCSCSCSRAWDWRRRAWQGYAPVRAYGVPHADYEHQQGFQ